MGPMSNLRHELLPLAEQYCQENGIEILELLGDGNDEAVWSTNRKTALKIVERDDSYEREKFCYFRLVACGLTEIQGFAIPKLVNHDDTRNAIEMEIVFPPSIFDFAKSYVDHPPDFSEEALADWERETRELFEDGQWPTVVQILSHLKAIGIHYFDARPWNIRFNDSK